MRCTGGRLEDLRQVFVREVRRRKQPLNFFSVYSTSLHLPVTYIFFFLQRGVP